MAVGDADRILALVALDCPDPRSLADFCTKVIAGYVKPAPAFDEWVRLVTGQRVDLDFNGGSRHGPGDALGQIPSHRYRQHRRH